MSKTSHLYRRNNVLYFRLSVPDRYRPILKVTQFTQSLHTQNRKVAIPAAYMLASEAKTLFLHIDNLMNEDGLIDIDLLRDVVESLDSKDSLLVARKKWVKSELLKVKKDSKIESLENDLLAKDREHRKELEAVRLKAKADAYDKLTSLAPIGAPATQQEPIVKKVSDIAHRCYRLPIKSSLMVILPIRRS